MLFDSSRKLILNTVFLVLLVGLSQSLLGQSVSFISWTYGNDRSAARAWLGDNAREPEWSLETRPADSLIFDFWLGVDLYYENSAPGTIYIDFTDEPVAKRRLGNFQVLRSAGLQIGTWFTPEQGSDPVFPERAAAIGLLIVEVEDQNGHIQQIEFGPVSSQDGVRTLFWDNANYTDDLQLHSTGTRRDWYIRRILLHGVRPSLYPVDGIEFFAIGLQGN